MKKGTHEVPAGLAAARVATQFKPGEGGRPKGTRDKLSRRFIEALAKDFDEHGEGAISAARERDPVGYMKVVAGLLPKEVEIKRPAEDLTDDELANAISLIRASLTGSVEGSGDGAEEAGSAEQASSVPAIH